MKIKFIAILVALGSACFASEQSNRVSRIEQAYINRYGGLIERPTSLKGTIGFVNAESGLAMSEVERVIQTISQEMKYNLVAIKGSSETSLPTRQDVEGLGLSVGIFIVSHESLPSLLVAPEERWSLVNIRNLSSGLPTNAVGTRLFAARCRGEIMRAFALVCGSGTSQYSGNILNATSIQDLDSANPDTMIYDMVLRCNKYLASIGITPSRKASYKTACEEGWAPAPTNDVQKAIWEKVKAEKDQKPSNPLKINFDPKMAPKLGE